MILVALMFIQNVRRTLECLFVSVYSKATMNVAHYSLGFFLYVTWGLVVLAEAPNPATYRSKWEPVTCLYPKIVV